MATPGAIVGSGALVTPGGAQGPGGAAGPTAVSTDTGNLAVLGSDSKILVPQSSIWSMRLRSFNAIGNPNFEIDQRNVGNISTDPSVMPIDRWIYQRAGTHSISLQQMAGTASDVFIPGTNFRISRSFYRITLKTTQASLGANDYMLLTQQVEGPQLRELQYDVHSLSVLVRSSVAGLSFGLSIRDGGPTTKSLTKLATIPSANTWTLLIFPNLPVFASGNFGLLPGSLGYVLTFCLAGGSSYTNPINDTWQNSTSPGAIGQSNFAASPVNSTFDIGFVQHEPGPVCSTLIDCPFGQNYDGPMGCLRYFQKTYAYATALGTVTATGCADAVVSSASLAWSICTRGFQKPLAKTPSLSVWDSNNGAANGVFNNSKGTHLSQNGLSGYSEKSFGAISVTPAQALGDWLSFHYIADTGW
jgi:hypothetical protein